MYIYACMYGMYVFRVHQFAGGFDEEATRLFNELHEFICEMQD